MRLNPYRFTGPLDPEKDNLVCISREPVISKVVQGLGNGNYYVINGPAQIGKTTFLRQINSRVTDCYTIYFNFQVSPSDEKNFYKSITQTFFEAIPVDSSWQIDRDSLIEKTESASDFLYFLNIFKPENEQCKILLLFDEIDGIPYLAQFLKIWSTIYTQRSSKHNKLNRYALVLISSQNLIQVTAGTESPFNIAEIECLKDFSVEQCNELIDSPFNFLNLSIENDAKTKLIDTIGGHPQLLQQACFLLVEKVHEENRERVIKEDVDSAINDLFNQNSALSLLESEIKNNNTLEKLIKSILSGEKQRFTRYKKYSIAGSGPIVEKNNLCAIRNKLFEQYLLDLYQLDSALPVPLLTHTDGMDSREIILISSPSDNDYLYPVEKKTMPCALKRLRIKSFHGIDDIDMRLPVDAKWIILTGENAYGKSAVLKSILIGFFGMNDNQKILLDPGSNSRIAVEFLINNRSHINNLRSDQFIPFTRFTAYGASRLAIQSDRTKNEIMGKSSKSYSLLNDDGVSLNIERELILWFLDDDPRFETAKEILLELMPHGSDIVVDRETKEVLYKEKETPDDGEKDFEPVRFDKLSAGNKSIIALIGDLLIRFYNEYQPENIHPKDFEGFVIIDELDLHLHPRWLRQLPSLLSRLFPKIQFIASTHSEITLLGAPGHSVFLKVTRTREKGIRVHRLPIDIKNLLSHHILTSPFFDMEDESVQAANENIADVRTEKSFRHIRTNDKITTSLNAYDSDERDLPEHVLDLDDD